MKTPDEIKKGLYHCGTIGVECTGCPYDGECDNQGSGVTPEADALTYIQQLEADVTQKKARIENIESRLMKSYEENLYVLEMVDAVRKLSDSYADRLAQAERERDAAVNELRFRCDMCKFYEVASWHDPCKGCACIKGHPNWQWRGVCP